MNGIVRISSDGSISWHADTAVVLGPVPFEVNGVLFTVDAAFPDVVVDLAASDASALAATAQWFTDPDAVRRLAAAGDGDVVDGPTLVDALATEAGVSVVDAVHLGDLDEAVLLLDHAFGRLVAGDEESATEFYLLSGAVAERLVDHFTHGGRRGPAVERLAEIVAAAPPGAVVEDTQRELRARLDALSSENETHWEGVTTRLFEVVNSLSLGAIEIHVAFPADLRSLPPRLLEFHDVEDAEIRMTVETGGVVGLEADLRESANTDSAETLGVFAVAADATTGELLAYAPTAVVDGRMVAQLTVGSMPTDSLSCALIGSGTDLDMLRLDATGTALTRIDRYCRYAWTRHRMAGALIGTVDSMTDDATLDRIRSAADQARADAVVAADSAVATTRQLMRRARGSSDEAFLADHLDALTRFAASMAEDPAIDGPLRPTLAELCLASEI